MAVKSFIYNIGSGGCNIKNNYERYWMITNRRFYPNMPLRVLMISVLLYFVELEEKSCCPE
jgi:hypothetical protein